MKRKALRMTALALGSVMGLGLLAACKPEDEPSKGGNNDKLVVMSEELNGLYNPFYATAGSDMEIVGATQISMLTTDANGDLACGENEATVALAWDKKTITGSDGKDDTEYYFVLKNGIKFSDGKPLTMNDVMFNLYVYLDPAYTGSTTMYSTEILGLQTYRQQAETTNDDADSKLTESANVYAANRLRELVDIFHMAGGNTGVQGSYSATDAVMRDYIKNQWAITDGYKEAIGIEDDAEAREQLLADYLNVVGDPEAENEDAKKGLFRKELEGDYSGAKEAYLEEPYKSAPIYYNGKQVATGFDEVVSFMYTEGFVTVENARDAATGAYDKTKIEKVTLEYNYDSIKNETAAINHVYSATTLNKFDQILMYWATGTQLRSEFLAKAKDVILHKNLGEGELAYKSISGIQSLGHMAGAPDKVTVAGKEYKVANYANGGYNNDGTVKNDDEYAVLRITIDGIDPKAEWNFSFTVAPHHYYSDPDRYPVNIAEEKYGVSWADYDFHKEVLQGDNSWGVSKNAVPLGAGPYVATDENNGDQPKGNTFYKDKSVYYKSNPDFLLGEPKVKTLIYSVISSANAISMLESGSVHFVTPQFTKQNSENLNNNLSKRGFKSVSTWQLGYGYIGINAQYVQDINLRKAIMTAMDTKLALEYYSTDTAVNICYPMSLVSWAYPREPGVQFDGNKPLEGRVTNNNKPWTQFTTDADAKKAIQNYMAQAGAGPNDSRLKLTFTIAGSSLVEHPVFLVFKKAADILNDCGWQVEVRPDPNALTKLATGSLAVWAAAWGSTIDPDMYQVYHKNSTASSVLAWGYDDILADSSTYAVEQGILTKLSTLIDQARETDVKTDRARLYKEAMELVLDLAVEMPVYQRQTLYAYNANVIDEDSLPHDENGELLVNSYSSPLSRIWEVELK